MRKSITTRNEDAKNSRFPHNYKVQTMRIVLLHPIYQQLRACNWEASTLLQDIACLSALPIERLRMSWEHLMLTNYDVQYPQPSTDPPLSDRKYYVLYLGINSDTKKNVWATHVATSPASDISLELLFHGPTTHWKLEISIVYLLRFLIDSLNKSMLLCENRNG